MRKLLYFIASILMLGGSAFAVQQVWTSSHTATADTTQILCRSTTYSVAKSSFSSDVYSSGGKAVLHSVCVNDAPSAGTITVYNSSSTAVNPFAVIRATSAVTSGCNIYDVNFSSGLVYTTSAANDVTFTFECY